MALALKVKAMNDTINEDGLLPSLLVFGTLPCFPHTDSTFIAQKERMRVFAFARKEMEIIIAQLRIATALLRKLPLAANHEFNPNDKVLIYREKEKIK